MFGCARTVRHKQQVIKGGINCVVIALCKAPLNKALRAITSNHISSYDRKKVITSSVDSEMLRLPHIIRYTSIQEFGWSASPSACSFMIPVLIFSVDSERHAMTKPFKCLFIPQFQSYLPSLHRKALRGSHRNPTSLYTTSIFIFQLSSVESQSQRMAGRSGASCHCSLWLLKTVI